MYLYHCQKTRALLSLMKIMPWDITLVLVSIDQWEPWGAVTIADVVRNMTIHLESLTQVISDMRIIHVSMCLTSMSIEGTLSTQCWSSPSFIRLPYLSPAVSCRIPVYLRLSCPSSILFFKFHRSWVTGSNPRHLTPSLNMQITRNNINSLLRPP